MPEKWQTPILKKSQKNAENKYFTTLRVCWSEIHNYMYLLIDFHPNVFTNVCHLPLAKWPRSKTAAMSNWKPWPGARSESDGDPANT